MTAESLQSHFRMSRSQSESVSETNEPATAGVITLHLNTLMEEVPLGIVELSEAGTLRSANTAARAFLGGVTGHQLFAALAEMVARAQEVEGTLEMRVGRGEVRVMLGRTCGAEGYWAVLDRDSASRQRAQIQAMRAMLAALGEKGAPEAVLGRAVARLAIGVPGSRLEIVRCDSKWIDPGAASGGDPPGPPRCIAMACSGAPVEFPSVLAGDLVRRALSADRPVTQRFTHRGVGRAFIVFPVRVEGRAEGALTIHGPEEWFGEGELRLAQSLAELAGALLLRSNRERGRAARERDAHGTAQRHRRRAVWRARRPPSAS